MRAGRVRALDVGRAELLLLDSLVLTENPAGN